MKKSRRTKMRLLLLVMLVIMCIDAFGKTITPEDVESTCRAYKLTKEFRDFKWPCEVVSTIAYTESRYRPLAHNREDLEDPHDDSYGLMQVKCSTARMVGLKYGCKQLYDEKINIRFGMKYLMYLIKNKYTNVGGPKDIEGLFAAWNAGTAFVCKEFNPGQCYPGEYINQGYVLTAMRHYKYLLGGKYDVVVNAAGCFDVGSYLYGDCFQASWH